MGDMKSLADSLPVLFNDIKDYNAQLVSAYKKRLKGKGYTEEVVNTYSEKMQELFNTALVSNHNAVICTPWQDLYETGNSESDLKIMNDATYGMVVPISSPLKGTILAKFPTSNIKDIEGRYTSYIRHLQDRFSYLLPDMLRESGIHIDSLKDWYNCFQTMSSTFVRYLVYSAVYKDTEGKVAVPVYESDISAVNYLMELLEKDLGFTVALPSWVAVCSDTDLYKIEDPRCDVPCVYEDWSLHTDKRYLNRVFSKPEKGNMLDLVGGLPKQIVYFFE